MYLEPITDPERIKRINEKTGLTEEYIAAAKKRCEESLKGIDEWAKKNPEKAKHLGL